MSDEARFRALFDAHWAAVERYARRRSSPDVSADVASEVFAIAWRRLEDVPSDALPWLYGVARRVAANQRRSAARAARVVDRLATQPAVMTVAEPHEQVFVGTAFGKLSDDEREVLGLVVWEGLSARRAAAALGCSVGAFTMRLTRARRHLRALLEEE